MEPAEFLTMQDIAVVTPEGFFRVEKVPFYDYTRFFCEAKSDTETGKSFVK